MEADEILRRKHPLLANIPNHVHQSIDVTPYRLYNEIAPVSDDWILFMNHIMAGNQMFAAEVQSMWVVAYFHKRIILPSIEEREKGIADGVSWCRLSISHMVNVQTLLLSAVFHMSISCSTILASPLIEKSWWRDLFEPVKPWDLGKVWKEYLDRERR